MTELSIDEQNTKSLSIIESILEGFGLLEDAELLENLYQQRAILDYATTVTDRGTFDAIVDENLAQIEECEAVLNEATNNKTDKTPTNALKRYFEHMTAGLSEDTLHKTGKALFEEQEDLSMNENKLSDALAALQPKIGLTEADLDDMARENVEQSIKGILASGSYILSEEDSARQGLKQDLEADLYQQIDSDLKNIAPFNEETRSQIIQDVVGRMVARVNLLTEDDIRAVAETLTAEDRHGVDLPEDFNASEVLDILKTSFNAENPPSQPFPDFVVDTLALRGRAAEAPTGHVQGS